MTKRHLHIILVVVAVVVGLLAWRKFSYRFADNKANALDNSRVSVGFTPDASPY